MSNILNKASLLLNPAGSSIAYKEGEILSALPNDGSGDFTFTGGNGGTRVNQQGYIESTPANFILNSEDSWGPYNTTIVTGISDPFGGTKAYAISNINPGNITDYAIKSSNTMFLKAGDVITYSLYMLGTGTIATYLERSIAGTYWFNTKVHTLDPNKWTLFTHSYTVPTDASGVSIYVGNVTGTTSTYVQVAFPMVNYGSTARPYQPTTDRLNYPRITYKNGIGSLMSEPARTNLVTNSTAGQYGNSPGSSVNTISPDGTNNATIPTPNAIADRYQITIFGGSYSSGTKITYSWHYKQLGPHNGPNPNEPGGLTSLVGIVNLNRIGDPEKLYDLPDGWSRWKITYEIANGSADAIVRNYFGYVIGIGYSTSAYFGHQYEIGEFATSYIPTGTSQVTRPADTCGANGVSVINASEGTLYTDMVINGTLVSDQFYLSLHGGSSSNSIYIGLYNIYGLFRVVNGGSLQANINPVFELNKRYKFALAYKANDVVAYINGVQVGSDTSVTLPSVTTFSINNFNENGNFETNTSAYFNSRLSSTELAELTTVRSGSGGNISYYGPYTIHTFTSSGTFTPSFTGDVEVLVVAGGGGGGANHAGGGGAGGFHEMSSYSVSQGSGITITIGAGGSRSTQFQTMTGYNGGSTSFGSLSVLGGGGGGNRQDGGPANLQYGKDGGSGGGSGGQGSNPAPNLWPGGAAIQGIGNPGGAATYHAGGGGGGAGEAGSPGTTVNGSTSTTFPGDGGDGLSSTITGLTKYFAGGGGGGGWISGPNVGAGGIGGGGRGKLTSGTGNEPEVDGVTNTGGGGGGAAGGGLANGGNGGSGIVIIRYLT